jgi:hypothetical protein
MPGVDRLEVQTPSTSPYRLWAWITAGLAVAFGAVSLTTALLAWGRQSAMEDYVRDNSCGEGCNGQPTLFFDDPAREIEADGKAYSGIANIFLGLTIVTAATSGFLWGWDYKYRHDVKRQKRRAHGATRLAITPWTSASGGGVVGRLDF